MKKGLYGKYKLEKTDGSPIDPKADYFILRLDNDPVARIAAREYALHTPDKELGEALLEKITKYFVEFIESDLHLSFQNQMNWPLATIRLLEKQLKEKKQWISIEDQLPEVGKLVFIYVKYEDSPYDNVKEAVSLGRYYGEGRKPWNNILDLFMDDGEIVAWMPLEFPEKPRESESNV